MERWALWFNQSTLLNLALVLGTALASYLLLRGLIGSLASRLSAWADKKQSRGYACAAAVLGQTKHVLIAAFSLLIGLKLVELSPKWEAGLAHGWFVALALQLALWLDAGMLLWSQNFLLNPNGSARNPVTSAIIAFMLRAALWSVMLLAVLSNLGVNITAFVASLGVGGIAIALAVQTLLSDLFASLAIGIDKPFERGDFVVFGNVAGSIEHIGMKTTRIRSLSGEQIVCANAELLKQTLHNYKRMAERRIQFGFGLSYQTPVEKVREIPALIAQIIQATPDTRFDRAHFLAFEDSALRFEVVYVVLSAEYHKYMDIQQHINLELMQALNAREIKFASAAQTPQPAAGGLPTAKPPAPPAKVQAKEAEGSAAGAS